MIVEHPELDIGFWRQRYPLEELQSVGTAPGCIEGIKPLIMNLQLQEQYPDAFARLDKVPVDLFMWSHEPPRHSYVTKVGGLPHRPETEPWPVDDSGTPLTFLCQFCFADSERVLPFEVPGEVMLIFLRDQETLYNPERGEYRIEWWPMKLDAAVATQAQRGKLKVPELSGVIFKTDHYPDEVDAFEEDDFRYGYTSYNIAHYQGSMISRTAFLDNTWLDDDEDLICCFYTQIEALEDATLLDGTSHSGWSSNIEDLLDEVCTIAVIRYSSGSISLVTAFD